uniref:Small ribosomal subunit protein bS18c n=1 Tax=Bulboplastis apyrenoidosa TaxID=1070855 RepID=A0A1Y9TM97_9RHOD|nr:30S ribosomal protein S18 [Bulboplastis apyrenoidosa]ARO90758.1 30S ribosomal protein S18 [Bulboplastis apyrenoidosa]
MYSLLFQSLNSMKLIHIKDIDLLRKFISDQGKIFPRRMTGLSCKQQKKITKAIKQARVLSLLPFVNQEAIS